MSRAELCAPQSRSLIVPTSDDSNQLEGQRQERTKLDWPLMRDLIVVSSGEPPRSISKKPLKWLARLAMLRAAGLDGIRQKASPSYSSGPESSLVTWNFVWVSHHIQRTLLILIRRQTRRVRRTIFRVRMTRLGLRSLARSDNR